MSAHWNYQSAMPAFEEYYGYSFLDELHNFFPDFLYNNQRFSTVADVFTYLNTQMNNRFNLYASARHRHRRPVRRAAAAPAPHRPVPYFDDMNYIDNNNNNNNNNNINNNNINNTAAQYTPSNMYGSAQAAAAPVVAESINRVAPGVSIVPPQRRAAQPAVDFFSTEFVIREPFGGLAGLASLLVPELQPRNLSDLFAQIPGFADPVVVRPTVQQITAATTIQTQSSTQGEVCAICQDDIIINCQTRKINHCDHKFHKGCIDTWFAQNVHCPVCRHDIRDVPVEGEVDDTEDDMVNDNIVD
jgi:hypothetical protein